jgi:alkanesulfonate monooxygenase SsuD/methylene tetrahydromethanopterin reductase-like flavin-dependent oxidoreductase (luciferase family)
MLRDAGHDPNSVQLPVNRFIYVGESNDRAIEETRETILRFVHRDNSVIRDFLKLPPESINYDLLFREVCIFGDADFCARRIEELSRSVDIRHLILTFNYFTIDQARCLRSMQRFVSDVLPRLRLRPDADIGSAGPSAPSRPAGAFTAPDCSDSHRRDLAEVDTQG